MLSHRDNVLQNLESFDLCGVNPALQRLSFVYIPFNLQLSPEPFHMLTELHCLFFVILNQFFQILYLHQKSELLFCNINDSRISPFVKQGQGNYSD